MPDEVPDLYVDSFRITITPYGVNLTFARSEPHPAPAAARQEAPQAVLRMSLEHAKSIAMLMRKQLKAYERENGEINLPPGLYTNLGVAREDWGFE